MKETTHTPHPESRSTLHRKVLETYSTHTRQFVETGSSWGAALKMALDYYPKPDIHSCETSEDKVKFIKDSLDIDVVNKDSITFLRELKLANVPTFFWLDAHSGGKECPLPRELELVLKKGAAGSVILIDDLPEMIKPAGWGEGVLQKTMHVLRTKASGYPMRWERNVDNSPSQLAIQM